jgi:L-amino acid N-acyltransferase YncA
MEDIQIDRMRPGDWDAVRRIPAWPEWDERHHSHSRLVARAGEAIVGWAALAPASHRSCYAGVAEVSLYVAEAWRGRGVGRRLLEALVESSERHGVWTLFGSTFPENEASLRLQAACGFRVVGRRERIARGRGGWRDTVLSERRSPVVGAD